MNNRAHNFLQMKRPDDPRDFVEQLAKTYPRETAQRIFHAEIIDNSNYLKQIARKVFDDWTSKPPQ